MDDIPSGNDKTGVSGEPGAPKVQSPPLDGRIASDRLAAAARLDTEQTIGASAPSPNNSESAVTGKTPQRNADATIVGTRPATEEGATIFAPGAFAPEAFLATGMKSSNSSARAGWEPCIRPPTASWIEWWR